MNKKHEKIAINMIRWNFFFWLLPVNICVIRIMSVFGLLHWTSDIGWCSVCLLYFLSWCAVDVVHVKWSSFRPVVTDFDSTSANFAEVQPVPFKFNRLRLYRPRFRLTSCIAQHLRGRLTQHAVSAHLIWLYLIPCRLSKNCL